MTRRPVLRPCPLIREPPPAVAGSPGACLAAAASRAAAVVGDLPGVERVELDAAGDPGDAGLAGLARREVSGLFGLAGTGPVRAVPDEEAGHEDLQQECR